MKHRTAKPMLWMGIVSICMLFAAFTSAYVVSRSKADWVVFDLPKVFYVSTALILLSSITMNWAMSSAKKDNLKNITPALLLTLILGCGFMITQYLGWADMVARDIYFMGSRSHPSGSYIYVITILHILHLVGGIIGLLIALSRSIRGVFNSGNLLGLQLCAIYWHFLDVLWIYLFFFLLIIR